MGASVLKLTNDGGNTWLDFPTSADLYAASCATSGLGGGNCFVAGETATASNAAIVLYNSDTYNAVSPQPWISLSITLPAPVQSIDCIAGGAGFVCVVAGRPTTGGGGSQIHFGTDVETTGFTSIAFTLPGVSLRQADYVHVQLFPSATGAYDIVAVGNDATDAFVTKIHRDAQGDWSHYGNDAVRHTNPMVTNLGIVATAASCSSAISCTIVGYQALQTSTPQTAGIVAHWDATMPAPNRALLQLSNAVTSKLLAVAGLQGGRVIVGGEDGVVNEFEYTSSGVHHVPIHPRNSEIAFPLQNQVTAIAVFNNEVVVGGSFGVAQVTRATTTASAPTLTNAALAAKLKVKGERGFEADTGPLCGSNEQFGLVMTVVPQHGILIEGYHAPYSRDAQGDAQINEVFSAFGSLAKSEERV